MDEYKYLIDELILLNKRNRTQDLKSMSSPLNYLMSFCTIHVDVGRRVGKTSYILDNANNNDLIIIPNPNFKNDRIYEWRENINLVTASNIENFTKEHFKNWDHKLIYVDEPRICYQYISPIALFSWILDKKVEQTIIMLGE
jgi:hypothetical protein